MFTKTYMDQCLLFLRGIQEELINNQTKLDKGGSISLPPGICIVASSRTMTENRKSLIYPFQHNNVCTCMDMCVAHLTQTAVAEHDGSCIGVGAGLRGALMLLQGANICIA